MSGLFILGLLLTITGITIQFVGLMVLLGKQSENSDKNAPTTKRDILIILDPSGIGETIDMIKKWTWKRNRQETIVMMIGTIILITGLALFKMN